MATDLLTKPLNRVPRQKLSSKLGLTCIENS